MNGIYPYWDFTWAAVDRDGFVGTFATAGDAPIPIKILPASEDEDIEQELFHLIAPVTDTIIDIDGSGLNLSSYVNIAKRGLFSYDWSCVRPLKSVAMYERIARPSSPSIINSLPLSIADKARKIFLNLSFYDLESIDINKYEKCVKSR